MRMVLCALVAVSWALAGCSSTTKVASEQRQSPPSVVIEPEDLARTLAQGGDERAPMLLDARKLEDYGPAHAAGAQRLDINDWTKASREGDGPNQGLRNTQAWSVRIGALGIDESTPVIVYDEGGMTNAARAWFILRECGVRDVRVVNGGWAQLCPALDPALVQAGNPGEFLPTRFAAKEPGRVVSREELKQIGAERSRAVIDVRSVDEYKGSATSTTRTGHVPGAANLPHKQLMNESGRLRSPEELRALFAGASGEKPAVLYCQSGGRAAFAALAAEHAGLSDTTVYYMSMGEWLPDASCPVERASD